MSVLGKRKRPADINDYPQSPKRTMEMESQYEYISSEDDDLKSGEINQLPTSTPPESTDCNDYFSRHKGYNGKQGWKLFFVDDYVKYKYGLEENKCNLDQSLFKKGGEWKKRTFSVLQETSNKIITIFNSK